MTASSASLLKERANFLKRQNDALAFTASNEKRQKVEKTSSQKTNRPKPTYGLLMTMMVITNKRIK